MYFEIVFIEIFVEPYYSSSLIIFLYIYSFEFINPLFNLIKS